MMKRIYLFVLACTIALAPAYMQAQSKAKEETKRVVIVKKSIDKDGDVVVEKTIGEGDQAEVILKEMALNKGDENVNITVIRNLDSDEKGENLERLFMFRSADGEKIEGRIESADNIEIHADHGIEIEELEDGQKRIITIRSHADGEEDVEVIEIRGSDNMPAEVREKVERARARVAEMHERRGNFEYEFEWDNDNFKESKTNCAALGVYVNTSKSSKGVRINDLIGGGGAEDSGLQEGDYLVAIEDDYVNSYSDLLRVLSLYVPGDDVNVSFTRDGQEANVVVTLKAWKEMPTMANSWRARVTCDEREDEFANIAEEVVKEEKQEAPEVEMRSPQNTLQLENFAMFPNPSDGKFRLQFMSSSEPITVSVTDITGKVVYRDNVNRFDGIYNDQVNLKKYGTGSYILTIEQNDQLYSEQIIVQ